MLEGVAEESSTLYKEERIREEIEFKPE